MTLTDTRVDDAYPTRITGTPEHLPRVHPTVWGTEADGPIDAATLANHETKGYTVVEDLLSVGEVQTYWQELVRLSSDAELAGDERVITEAKTGEVRSIFDVHEISALIAELVRDPRVLDRARQLLGSEVYVHQSRVNYMPGFKGTGFYWHSDFETWHAEDGMPAPRAVSCSIALTDNHPFNGGLMIMPGSHRTFVQCAGETPEANYKSSLKDQRVGVPSENDITRMAAEHGIDQFTGQAGSALWFDSNIMHGSGNNITPYPRSNIFLVFNSVENALQEPFAAGAPRPAFIAGRDATPITR
ncbi:ectoine hydroxylase [Amycolatopsis mediterranei S699]|uniref:Ectoine hydroxylase n=2 Tax=Amycolatopsis mediterranei TaxID=33910 RepID=A0A0H3DKQ4_AMYMU|nr:ectoine hydroxylase [Amycolatopsis mediterranei]ADJ50289.1 ectoine hydroxylase [Amycolatopsis mediterranei U32]AEK47289.1 ectoine hydroxylase [Amycolatopsis mediterranei S699]AFO81995.1 ectoine hydroxylase [Amycolatopsis mediterranei S699]AGT89124.1 ectoine hydroxylase [Amycolatopsis mediterranei RB]KDO08326.1 multidrug DMT transporter permease [Amycolatopsis mediterranei]